MSGTARTGQGLVPKGQALRQALRWMSDEGRHDPAAVEEACRRFDLSPVEEEFLLAEIRRLGGTRQLRPTLPARHRVRSGPRGEAICRPAEDDEFLSRENVRILESWNVEADRELSIARARLGPGDATEAHRLTGITERYLVIQGTGMVHIGTLSPAKVGPGDVVFIPPGVIQQIRNTGDTDLVFYCICTPAFDEACYAGVTRASQGDSDAK